MIDYTIFYKQRFRPEDDWTKNYNWDLFISAFNSSERVQKIFSSVNANEKHWLILPEYHYTQEEYPSGKVFVSTEQNEADYIQRYFTDFAKDVEGSNLCIDITGFMRPHLMFMIKYLMVLGVRQFDVLYTDPGKYVRKEETKFSDEVVLEIRQVEVV